MVLEYGLHLARCSLALEVVEMIIERGRISPVLVSWPDKGNMQKWVWCLVQELAEQVNSHLAWFFRMLKMSARLVFVSSVVPLGSKSLVFGGLMIYRSSYKTLLCGLAWGVLGRHITILSAHILEESGWQWSSDGVDGELAWGEVVDKKARRKRLSPIDFISWSAFQ